MIKNIFISAVLQVFLINTISACERELEDKDYTEKQPTKEQCEGIGGKVNAADECEKPLSKKECDLIGGTFDKEIGCYTLPTKEECEAFGGTFSESGECV